MPLPDSGSIPISHKDVLSFVFDEPNYDVDRPVFIDPQDPSIYFSYRSAKDLVKKLIAGLLAAGLEPGDAVCLHSFNSIWYPLIVLAIIGAGGLSVGTNPSYTKAELKHAVEVAKIKFVLAEPEIVQNMLAALQESNIDIGRRLFILDTQVGQIVPQGLRSWRSLVDHGTKDWIRFNDEKTATDTVAQLYYTSGTTGLPKCAMTTHKNLIAQHTLFFGNNPRSYRYRIALCMPFFHAGIQPQAIVSSLKEGREAYVMRRFDLEPFLWYHAKYHLTEVFIVPPMVKSVVMSGLADPASPRYRPEYSLKSVQNGTTGAAPCSGDLQKRFSDLLASGATFTQIWGMTETTSMATMVPWTSARQCAVGKMQIWGSVGKPLPCMQIKLVDERGHDVTDKGKGEILVKGPTIVKGYFENEKATQESWDADGYFRTGDVVQLDKYGLLYVVERLKELIKVRGFQVAPAELEGVLTKHSDIVDAAVIGIAVSSDEEAPKAIVVRKLGSTLTIEDVHAHMKKSLAGYKQLTGGVEFVESIPKLPSGKILKRVLREQEKQKLTSHGRPKL